MLLMVKRNAEWITTTMIYPQTHALCIPSQMLINAKFWIYLVIPAWNVNQNTISTLQTTAANKWVLQHATSLMELMIFVKCVILMYCIFHLMVKVVYLLQAKIALQTVYNLYVLTAMSKAKQV